jgi:large repetitive protein
VNGDTQSVVSGTASLTTTATTSSAPGTYPITAALGTLSALNYTFSTFVNGTLTITRATPTITWATPAAITYGTALSGTQLDATASVAGTFVYSPAAGRVLAAGTQTLSVTFTPTNTTDYISVTDTVTLVVNEVGTTTTITSNLPNPSTTGKAVVVKFTVAQAMRYSVPTGGVTVNASTGESCTATLASGSGSCSVTFNSAGSRTLTATYAGDNNNNPSVSAAVTQTVN